MYIDASGRIVCQNAEEQRRLEAAASVARVCPSAYSETVSSMARESYERQGWYRR